MTSVNALVVDDSSAMRAFVRAALEDELGAEVVEAPSGFEALRLLPRSQYSIVVADVNMPDINGLELVRFMRDSPAHRDTPILLISTEASPRDQERGLALGADEFLSKPFGADALVALVKKLVEREP